MNSEFRGPLTEGHVFRVTLSHLTPPESYLGVYVRFDVESNLVHIFGPDSKTLYLTIPLGCVIVEWRDPAVLKPQPRTPPYAPATLEELEEQLRQFTGALGNRIGET